MNQPPLSLLALLTGLLGGVTAVGAVPELAFLAQFTAIGVLLGSAVALYRDRKSGVDGDRRFMIVTVWTIAGTVIGLILLAAGVA